MGKKRIHKLLIELSRRRMLEGMGAVLGTTALGCGDDDSDDGASTSSGGSTSGATSTTTTSSTTSGGSSGGETGGSSGGIISDCSATTTLTPEELLADIDTFVVVMMENRSFDHYFGSLSLTEGQPVEGLTGNEANGDGAGNSIGVYPLGDDFVTDPDPPHAWNASHAQFAGGNGGFVTEYENRTTTPQEVMGYYERAQLPTLYELADNFALCERWFASVMGGTWPNRFYLHLATSEGVMGNGTTLSGVPSIFHRMEDAGFTATYYSSNLPVPFTYGGAPSMVDAFNFFDQAAAGTLPNLAMIDPVFSELGPGNDDHAPEDVRNGQAFLRTVYEALAQSPQWDRCMLIITYDEHGGFYDHVEPPTTFDERPEFEQLGFRVPSLVIGPTTKRGCAVAAQLDHVSVAATLTRRFGLVPLNRRVSMTQDLSVCIDPNFVGDPQPPATLAPQKVVIPPDFTTAHRQHRGQPELGELADQGVIPKHLDKRHETAQRVLRMLEVGRRLGAVRIER